MHSRGAYEVHVAVEAAPLVPPPGAVVLAAAVAVVGVDEHDDLVLAADLKMGYHGQMRQSVLRADGSRRTARDWSRRGPTSVDLAATDGTMDDDTMDDTQWMTHNG